MNGDRFTYAVIPLPFSAGFPYHPPAIEQLLKSTGVISDLPRSPVRAAALCGDIPVAGFALIAPAAHADTWTVDNTGDPASGAAANCAAGNANTCSLREPPVAALPPRRWAPAAATERFAAAFSASAAHL